MTALPDLDRSLPAWLDAEAQVAPPSGLLDAALARTAARSPRPGWLASVRVVAGRSAWPGGGRRAAKVPMRVLLVALLVVALLAGLALAAGAGPTVAPLPSALMSVAPSVRLSPTVTSVRPSATPGPLFAAAGTLVEERPSGATLTRLVDGRIAITGGGPTTVEIWDPATGRSAAAGQMAIARTGHLATLLADGRIILVGGTSATDPNRDLASAEIYDPATGMSVPTGSMRFPRTSCHCGVSFIRLIEPAAIRMADGRVMVVGGRQMTAGGVTDRDSTAEIGRRSPARSMRWRLAAIRVAERGPRFPMAASSSRASSAVVCRAEDR